MMTVFGWSDQSESRVEDPLHAVSAMPRYADTAAVIANRALHHPVYLFSETYLTAQAQRFQQLFPGQVTYAVKSNPHPRILQTLIDAGLDAFDVASLYEIKQIHDLLPSAELHFNNPVKSDESVIAAYNDYGVRSFVIDDTDGLEQILALCKPAEQELEISVRFTNPKRLSAYDFGSKFGAYPEEMVDLLKAVQAAGQRITLAFHPGSQCADPEAYTDYINLADQFVREAGVTVTALNVGGGFPAAYGNYDTADLRIYIDHINQAFIQTAMAAQATPAKLICEPGRAMVADCMSLLAFVLHKRDNGDLFINDGVYGSFQEQMIVELGLPIITWKGGKPSDADREAITIFGPTCDPVDKMANRAVATDTDKGDWLEFGLMGAYSLATATNFNGFPVPEMIAVDAHSFTPKWLADWQARQ